MKRLAPDIQAVIEGDAKKLTEALISGEISVGKFLPDYFDESEIENLAFDILNFICDQRLMAPIIQYLGTMKWLSLQEACIYSRKSKNTLLALAADGTIYATREGMGDWVFDRESIDRFYNRKREKDHARRADIERRMAV